MLLIWPGRRRDHRDALCAPVDQHAQVQLAVDVAARLDEHLVDRQTFKASQPAVAGLRWVEDMRAEEQRKLYTYNLYQAALAYLGTLRGHVIVAEALADPITREIAR